MMKREKTSAKRKAGPFPFRISQCSRQILKITIRAGEATSSYLQQRAWSPAPVANHNRYDLLRQQAFFEGEARDRPEKRAFLLCRSGGPEMMILVYPEGRSSFTLHEDDGETNSYRTGGFVLAEFECETSPDRTRIRIGASQGEAGLCAVQRSLTLRVHSAMAPQTVEVMRADGGTPQPSWGFDGCFFNCVVRGAPARISLRY
jgi:hypothetical protein